MKEMSSNLTKSTWTTMSSNRSKPIWLWLVSDFDIAGQIIVISIFFAGFYFVCAEWIFFILVGHNNLWDTTKGQIIELHNK
jgi:hypothetical protein